MGGHRGNPRPESRRERNRLLRTIAMGLLVFAIGAGLAMWFLPEWKTGPFRDDAFYRQRFEEVAARGGFHLEPGEPRVRLASWATQYKLIYQLIGERAAGWMTASHSAIPVEVRHGVTDAHRKSGQLFVLFTADGQPWGLALWPRKITELPTAVGRKSHAVVELSRPLLRPGERLGTSREIQPGGVLHSVTWEVILIEGPDRVPQQFVGAATGALWVHRAPRHLPGTRIRELDRLLTRSTTFSSGFLAPLLLLAGGALFLALLARDQMGAAIGAVLAVASLTTASLTPNWYFGLWVFGLGAISWMFLTVFVLWSSGESLLRSQRFDFTTSLDTLRAGRLGPRGGRALLAGCGYGAGLAGLCLGLAALAVALPGVSPTLPVPDLPVFRPDGGLVGEGILLAATTALAFAVTSRFLAPRWAPWAAALLAAPLVPVYLLPHAASWAAQALGAAVLVEALRRRGLAALLVAAVVSTLLPAALWSALHLPFLAGSFAATAAPVAAFVGLGLWGLGRPAENDAAARPPRFVRRLEERRRRRYETDLLARMQAGMLPERIAAPPGYEVAARAILSKGIGGNLYDALRDSGGGFWVVSGDVAGSGLACSIAQAMIKAALHSLVSPDLPPSEVLAQTSTVLRGVDPQRNLAGVALVRIEPESGECRLANAGHPAPLRVIGSEVYELELTGPLLGEPTGEEGDRPYRDLAFALPPGGLLLLLSETLFDEQDRKRIPFGMERVRAALRASAGRPAEEVLDGLLKSWRRHLGTAELTDDTTVVVVRRLPREQLRG
jgi:serine phosphatase RsbU (regulator of sigma subunit)